MKEINFNEIPWDSVTKVSFSWFFGEGYRMYLIIDNVNHEVVNVPKALLNGIKEHSYDLAKESSSKRLWT